MSVSGGPTWPSVARLAVLCTTGLLLLLMLAIFDSWPGPAGTTPAPCPSSGVG